MIRCARCCLHNSIKIVNVVILFFGIGIIIYSLWLENEWHHRLSLIPVSPFPKPKPWFILACLGIGISVSLSTLCGYAVANYIGHYTLAAYIFIISCLLLLEACIVIFIFFKMNWILEFAGSVDEAHKEFVAFVIFHVKFSRVIVLLILAAQVNAVTLAAIFWGVGVESRTHYNERLRYPFSQSFLVPVVPEPDSSIRYCARCGIILGENSRLSFFSYINSAIRARFERRNYLA